MFLAIDIGNSNIVVALYQDGMWRHSFRYETKDKQPEYYYEGALRNLLLEWRINASEVQNCVLISVVPDLNAHIREAVLNVTGVECLVLGPEIIKNIDISVPKPYEIGSDLVCNAYAAVKRYGPRCIIADFGTALSFTVVHHEKGILGVTIAPGIKTAIRALFLNTAQLPEVPLKLPDSYLGFDTVSAIQAGVLWGFVGLVRHIVAGLKEELGEDYTVIATGGLSAVLHPLEDVIDVTDKFLTLDGGRLIYEFNSGHFVSG
jgi:type III pantothenate kinase